MDQERIINCTCRDGMPARVQKVPYLGKGKGMVLFGHRKHPDVVEYDADGIRNEAGDLWLLGGFWREDMRPHAFDIISASFQHTPPTFEHAYGT